MADKSFGVKDINLIGASGTPEIESPNNLNIKAVNVAISTDMSIGGNLGIGSVSPSKKLDVRGETTFGEGIQESDLSWGTDTYQRAYFFSGASGGATTSPADGVVALANPNDNPSNTRVGAIVFGSSASGTSNTTNPGLKAAIETYTNTNVTNAADTGGYLRFLNKPDNGNLSERLRIDSSGRIGINASTFNDAGEALRVQAPSGQNNTHLTIKANSTSGYSVLNFGDDDFNEGRIKYDHSDNSMGIFTNDAERLRVNADGSSTFENFIAVNQTGSTEACFHGRLSGTNTSVIRANGSAMFASYNDSSASGFGVDINVNANAGDVRTQCQSTASQYTQMYGAYFGSTKTFHVLANGNVQNTNNSYSQISDVKLKENIVDANSQWNDVKSVQVRNFNFKSETGISTHTQIGVIAQEIEAVSPGLVYETPDLNDEGEDLGTVTKAVSYSVLYMKSVKALQEAMTRIETLEAKVAALEG